LPTQCTTGKERRIKRWEHEAVIDAMQDRLDRAPLQEGQWPGDPELHSLHPLLKSNWDTTSASPSVADALVAERKLQPLKWEPDATEFDPMNEPDWTLLIVQLVKA
jgi:hypothetical protein